MYPLLGLIPVIYHGMQTESSVKALNLIGKLHNSLTLSSVMFQQRVQAKESSVRKYQELLKQARQDLEDQSRRHEEELRMLQDKLHSKNDDAFYKFKQHIQESLQQPSQTVPSNEQVRSKVS